MVQQDMLGRWLGKKTAVPCGGRKEERGLVSFFSFFSLPNFPPRPSSLIQRREKRVGGGGGKICVEIAAHMEAWGWGTAVGDGKVTGYGKTKWYSSTS